MFWAEPSTGICRCISDSREDVVVVFHIPRKGFNLECVVDLEVDQGVRKQRRVRVIKDKDTPPPNLKCSGSSNFKVA